MSIKTKMARAAGEMNRKQEILQENQEIYRILADFAPDLALLRNPDRHEQYGRKEFPYVPSGADIPLGSTIIPFADYVDRPTS